ncbi:MAG TPA: methionyl-tRNA formyltransferase, partial [Blastocatellia bacterium]|nr:methionyl-tRNA formyltransferase [Blastocatellia bacterium]
TRGFQPWPGAYTHLRGARLMIWRASVIETGRAAQATAIEKPGLITLIDKRGITVAAGGGSLLRLEELQIEGKKRLAARDFLNGVRLKAGDSISDR